VTIFGNYGTPSISRQRLKLEIRNLARRLIVRCPIVKNENLGQNGSPGGHVTIFGNYGTPSISLQRLKLEIRNLAWRLIASCPIVKNENFGQKGFARGWRDQFGEFWYPLHISAMAEGRNSKFGMQNDREDPYLWKMKISVKRGHVTIFGNYGTPSISRQRLKLEIGNLACRLIARCPVVKKWKFW